MTVCPHSGSHTFLSLSASERFFLPSREPAGRGADGAEEEAGGEGAAREFCECTKGSAWGDRPGEVAGEPSAQGWCPVSKNKAKEEPQGGPSARGVGPAASRTWLVLVHGVMYRRKWVSLGS